MGVLALALPLLAALFLIVGDMMNHRAQFPKFDLFLASATAAPVATHQAASAWVAPHPAPLPLFTAPLVEFEFHGALVFLTTPDVLALIASAIMLVRFVAWAIQPVTRRLKGKGACRECNDRD
ncbi:hypothetical protein RCCRONUS_21 [Rhodobacter phage RcCronus]|uniref:Uncharacterized protein n=3 Tax=Cronusvirus cronus TaxID=2005060 RepID=A0A0K1LM65_9CAUD|nr:hypothetical protein RCRHEA_21 [Rhodobacter phage RcRhea]YP_009616311.1 hypothetical protein FDI78_gp21 [Rhodobacter phage RcCronus]AKU43265.1 hypothetical protein RCRHEA_21 [Rhodobacter phage RcRhea]AKU43310.1 hypothetical protein RCCRONUS_21 [Rhodobacter phage RcCronus]AKY02688.1 hypothetical protein RCSAXON_21 [Rhodobacter phage RcSaxon]